MCCPHCHLRSATLTHAHEHPQSKLGGGEGVEGIYGSITATGMQKIFDCMHHSCALNAKSALVDIGAGLGRWA